jgi:hypothetical protein
MRTITFEGGSDDLVEIGGAPGGDEFNVNPKGELGYAGTWRVEAGGDVLLVHAFYDGTWWFAAGASFDELGDGGEIPEWPIDITRSARGCHYSACLMIEAPDSATVEQVTRES